MTDTKTKILDVAERMTQTKGFNGFSYLDLAEEIGIKTSSIHYHFKTKADLALALVDRAHDAHVATFNELDSQIPSAEERLSSVLEVFEGYLGDDKFCLCGMLSAELQSISPAVRKSLKSYFNDVRSWFAKQLKEIGFGDAEDRALRLVCAVEGSLLLARLYGDATMMSTTRELVTQH